MLRRHQFDDITLLEQRMGMTTTGECENYVDYMLQNTADCTGVSCNSAPVSTLLTLHLYAVYSMLSFVCRCVYS